MLEISDFLCSGGLSTLHSYSFTQAGHIVLLLVSLYVKISLPSSLCSLRLALVETRLHVYMTEKSVIQDKSL